MLEHNGITATGREEKAGTEELVGEQHRNGASQYRHYRDQEVGRNEPGPDEHRHLQERHVRCAHVYDRNDDIDRAHDRRQTHEVNRENQEWK